MYQLYANFANKMMTLRMVYSRGQHMERDKNLQKSFYIGEFYMVNYQPMLKKYLYHRISSCLLHRNEFNKSRKKNIFMTILLL